jgi:hypothetical protein
VNAGAAVTAGALVVGGGASAVVGGADVVVVVVDAGTEVVVTIVDIDADVDRFGTDLPAADELHAPVARSSRTANAPARRRGCTGS